MKNTLHKLFIGLSTLLITHTSYAQNLVPNPSFESYGTLPCSWITSSAGFNSAINNWTMPTSGSSDIFSTLVGNTCYASCFSTNASSPGQQAPRTGNVMSAILTYGSGCGSQPNYREYLEIQLSSPMIVGETYDVEFYVSFGERCAMATNNIGAHFSTNYISSTNCFVLNFVPQINETTVVTNSTGWQRISGTIVATQAFQYMTIGNFFSNAATSTQANGGPSSNARYFIDDVSVERQILLGVDFLNFEVQAVEKTAVLNWEVASQEDTDFYTIERSKDGIVWEAVAELDKHEFNNYHFIDEDPFGGVSYYRIKENSFSEAFTFSDVKSIEIELLNNFVNVYPNPTDGLLNVELQTVDNAQLIVIDNLGRRIDLPLQWNNRGAILDLSGLPYGTYYLRVYSGNLYKMKKITLGP